MKAFLKNYRQSPRKVRLVADLVRGKRVKEAHETLTHLPKRAAFPLRQLLASAAANARSQTGQSADELFIQDIQVNKGAVMKRYMPRAHGRAARITHESSHVSLVLGTTPKAGK